MKKKLLIRNLFFILMIVPLLSTGLKAQTIVYVYDPSRIDAVTSENPDIPVMKLFEEKGYTVTPFPTYVISSATTDEMGILNDADLIFIGRAVGSANFSSPNKELWHAIEKPIMTCNMWALRSSRMNWFNIDQCSNIDDPMDSIFKANIVKEDAVFEGQKGPVDWWKGHYSTIDATDAGNGEVLATKSGNGSFLFVRFKANQEFYSGSVDIPAGPRVFFGSPSDNLKDENGNNIFNYLGFSEKIQKVFLNEVARLTGVFHPISIRSSIVKKSPSVYPVPAKNILTVELENLNKVNICDLAGQIILSYSANNKKMTFDVSTLKSGIYLLQINDKSGNIAVKKFIKE
jgi:hypothetical protein